MEWIFPAALPSLFWLWLVLRHDRPQPEPLAWVAACFFSGALAVLPALPIEDALSFIAFETRPASFGEGSVAAILWQLFFPVVVVEEVVKFLAFLLPMIFCRHLDEPLDGIVYGAAAGLGFAAAENYLYLLRHPGSEWVLLGLRSSTAVLLHLGTTAWIGMAFAKVRLGFPRPFARLVGWIAVALLFHTVYDLVAELGAAGSGWARGGMVLLGLVLVALLVLLSARIRRGRELSAFFPPHRAA